MEIAAVAVAGTAMALTAALNEAAVAPVAAVSPKSARRDPRVSGRAPTDRRAPKGPALRTMTREGVPTQQARSRAGPAPETNCRAADELAWSKELSTGRASHDGPGAYQFPGGTHDIHDAQ